MSLLARLFRPQAELSPALSARLDAWRALPALDERTSLAQARFVVADVETSGLDPRRDRLLAIGAVAVANGRLCPGEGYEIHVHNPEPSARENILVHGITPDDQVSGMAADEALTGFLELARHDVLVAFHAGFDRLVLERAAREALGLRLPNPWLDLAALAPALVPEARGTCKSLDEWLAFFGLRARARHSAVYDAYVSAELFLILLARARQAGLKSISQLLAAAERRT